VIGVIEGEQRDEKKKKERNDRIIAIQEDAHSWADVKTIDDLGKEFCHELEDFFVNYHELSGKEYLCSASKAHPRPINLLNPE